MRPLLWGRSGYSGDIFHQELTTEAPDGWNWEGVLIHEELCYISDDFGLTCEEITRLENSNRGEFQVVQGDALFPQLDEPPEDPERIEGLWIAGAPNSHGDKHVLGVGADGTAYSTIIQHFTTGPGTTGSVRYKQKYFIAEPGQNEVDFGQQYIAEVMIEVKFEKIPPEHPTYTNQNMPFHQLVDKGGAHNAAAWGGVPNWFGFDFLKYGLSDNPRGYGLTSNGTTEYCTFLSNCYEIVLERFEPVVVPVSIE